MLTHEDRRRIEAEEQHRAEVRARLESRTTEPLLAVPPQNSHLPWILAIGAVLAIAARIWSGSSGRANVDDDGGTVRAASSTPVPKTRYVRVKEDIAKGQITIKAGRWVQYRLTIRPEMIEPTISGTFNSSGGLGNDITAVIADEMNFTNWINGHQSRVFWGPEGKQTAGNFDVRLAPGMYYLVFSNKFSVLSDKQVFLNAELRYRKAETYY